VIGRGLFLVAVVCIAATASAQARTTPASPKPAATPVQKCQFEFDNPPTTRLASTQLPSKAYNLFFGGGVVAKCKVQKLVLKSDSLEYYGDEGRFYFVGHVDYSDPKLKLKSDFLTYYQKEERLFASLNVDAKLPSGSMLKGPSLEYFRAVPKIRPQARAIAIARPTVTIIDKDAQGKPLDPMTVTGATIWMEGDSVVSSSGNVIVVRPEITAAGDSLYLDGGKGLIRMMRSPKITGTKGRPFTLVGETIDILSRKKKIERVLSKNAAEAVSEDLTLKSDTIDLRVADDLLQRAITWGKSRAHATSPSQNIVSDSIDVLMPGQRVREMHAIRGAVAEGTPDTTKYKTKDKDRLAGDTIIAHFDSIPARDTSSKPRIRQLLAIAHASSYQNLPPSDTTIHRPAINYVCGQRITVTFDSAKVRAVKVEDPGAVTCSGGYFEPQPDSTSKARAAAKTPPAKTPPNQTPPANVPPKPAALPTRQP
jgi:lipopolysaccharide export system protein LptA